MANTKITVANMAANSIDSDQYVDGSIDTAHIADGQITVGKMAANSVDSAQYVDGSIDTAHYADNSITGAELADNIVIAGTLGSTGKITADAGIDIDNFNIDGTTIALSSGDLTLDVAGNINLDADGGTISLKDGGTEFAFLAHGGSDKLSIKATIQDADIGFFGNDGGGEITALTLDMSNAGLATFNNGIKAGADVAAFGANTGSSANRMAMSMEGSGVSRLICNGADVNTNGTFEVFTANSSGTGSAKLTVDSSGNLLVGQSSTTIPGIGNTTAGISIRGTDGSFFSRSLGSGDTNNVVSINRSTADGNILGFQKDGTTVGSIGVNTGDKIYLGTGASGVAFSTAGLLPFSPSANNWSDNSLNLGLSGIRWKDLYLSGGVHLGGTTAANKLDDYEEGVYDATISCASGSITLYTSYTRLRYTKIGRQVHIQGKLAMSAVSSPSGATNLNLPFASANDTNRSGVANNIMTGFFNGSAVTNGIYPIYGNIEEASSNCRLFIMIPPATNNLGDNHVAAGSDIHVNFTYTVQ